MISTPVLFLLFNRPDTTRQVFEAIRQAQPTQLFIAADGPRPDKPEDIEKCKQARDIATQVDWECEVNTLFREQNLGCKYAVSSAIDWFFENVEEGIILEDDTLPDKTFFHFCQQLLSYYRSNEKIMHISGNNSIFYVTKNMKYSYYFSNYSMIWGWATWRRAWNHYNVSLKEFNVVRDYKFIRKKLGRKSICKFWINTLQDVKNHKIDTWDVQWMYTLWKNNGIAIIAANNLVTNLGFSYDALHTRYVESPLASLPLQSIQNITHPPSTKILTNRRLELKLYVNQFNTPTSLANKIRNIAYLIIPKNVYNLVKSSWFNLRGKL